MSRHRKQQLKRQNRQLSNLSSQVTSERAALIYMRLENTGKFPSYATQAERVAFLNFPGKMAEIALSHRW